MFSLIFSQLEALIIAGRGEELRDIVLVGLPLGGSGPLSDTAAVSNAFAALHTARRNKRPPGVPKTGESLYYP